MIFMFVSHFFSNVTPKRGENRAYPQAVEGNTTTPW